MVIDQEGLEASLYYPNTIFQEDCKKYDGQLNLIFNRKSVVINGMGVMAYGAYVGVLIQAKYFPKMNWPFMLYTNWK
jgi:hypothetical protein